MTTTMSSGQFKSILELAEQKGMDVDRMTLLLSSGVLSDVFDLDADLSNREAVRQALKLGLLLPEQIIITVDYGMNLEQMVVAGRYDWINSNITSKHFPVSGNGKVEFEGKLFHFNRGIKPNEADSLIKEYDNANPWVSGKIEHLLSFGAKYPKEQREYPIIALGSVAEVDGYRSVTALGRDDSGRRLSLDWHGIICYMVCRFLAVRLVSRPLAT